MSFEGAYKGEVKSANFKLHAPTIYFNGKNNVEIIRLEPNGDIFVHGNKVKNDKEVVKGMRVFLESHRY